MIQTTQTTHQLPRTMAEFADWEPNDGYKYEWNDGELIKMLKMNKTHLILIRKLIRLFNKTNDSQKGGLLIQEQDVRLTGIQIRRPDLAFFSAKQIDDSIKDEDPIPEFVIEVISTNDQIIPVKNKLNEYFKGGVRVVWLIFMDEQAVEIYTSRRNVKICLEDDICSASPVLPDFEISVADIFVAD